MTTQSIAYIGNFQPEHSTESHVLATLRREGHKVVPVQENDLRAWTSITNRMLAEVSFVLWTRTGWNPPVPHEVQHNMLERARAAGTPVVGFHLDRWWGLGREGQVHTEPFFRSSVVCTADGGHDHEWAEAGVRHVWLPPAIAEFEIGWGRPRAEFSSPVAFVGSWQSYHDEWPWRRQLIDAVRNEFGHRFRCWPQPGQHAVRGAALRDLYASADVIVGDSCLVGSPRCYWSDRIPETLGRAGLLIHPHVSGMQGHFVGGEHLVLVAQEDTDAMVEAIEWALSMPEAVRMEIRRAGMRHVMDHHTYRHRMAAVLAIAETLRDEPAAPAQRLTSVARYLGGLDAGGVA